MTCATSAIASTLPSGAGQRNGCLFRLARHLKAMIPDADAAQLRAIVREWHRRALPTIRTKDFSESWADFVRGWERVKRPAGQSLSAAVAAADAAGPPAIVAQLGYDGHLARLVAMCWQLAHQWGDRPFPLGCRTAGDFLGVSPVHAWRLLKALQFDGLLELVSKGSKGTGKASEWRFNDTQME